MFHVSSAHPCYVEERWDLLILPRINSIRQKLATFLSLCMRAVTSAHPFRPKPFSFAITLHLTCRGRMVVRAKWMQNQISNMRNILPHVRSIVPKILGMQLVHPRHYNVFRMMRVHAVVLTSSDGNTVRVTGLLSGEPTSHRWIPLTKASDVDLWYFLWCAPEQTLK